MSRIRTLSRKASRPQWWRSTAIPYATKTVSSNVRSWYTRMIFDPEAPPCHLMDEDWDNLILLDACRYDQFERTHPFDGTLEARTSLGSATPEFLQANFGERTYYDTVYVTANPMYRKEGLGDVFFESVDVWESHWDDYHETVLPESMVEPSIDAYRAYPDKRILVHFMQPHYPFIGEKAEAIGAHAGSEKTLRQVRGEDGERDHPTVWDKLKVGEVSREAVLAAYDENLELAYPHVRSLLETFEERTVVTSDHGNLLGERPGRWIRPIYGHPSGVYSEGLRKVPWFVLDGHRRKAISAGATRGATSVDNSVVEDRLADLGYLDG